MLCRSCEMDGLSVFISDLFCWLLGFSLLHHRVGQPSSSRLRYCPVTGCMTDLVCWHSACSLLCKSMRNFAGMRAVQVECILPLFCVVLAAVLSVPTLHAYRVGCLDCVILLFYVIPVLRRIALCMIR